MIMYEELRIDVAWVNRKKAELVYNSIRKNAYQHRKAQWVKDIMEKRI